MAVAFLPSSLRHQWVSCSKFMKSKNNKFDPKKYTRSNLGLSILNSKGPKGAPTLNDDLDVEELRHNLDLLYQAERYYSSLEPQRRDAARWSDLERGKQWKDIITVDGQRMTEEQYIRSQGKIPLSNNRVASIIDTIVGQWLQNPSKSTVVSRTKEKQSGAEMLQGALEACLDAQQIGLLDMQAMKNLMIKKIICTKTTFGYISERDIRDGKVMDIPIDRLFFKPDIEDVRTYKQTPFIGSFIDYSSVGEVVQEFAKNKKDEDLIRGWYENHVIDTVHNKLRPEDRRNLTFWNSSSNNSARVYEIWYEEVKWRLRWNDPTEPQPMVAEYDEDLIAELNLENQSRIAMYQDAEVPENEWALIEIEDAQPETVTMYKYLTPSGFLLSGGETPYKHGSHPFTLFMMDRGLVETIEPQQKYIDHLITLINFMIGASAKGVLIVPESVMGDMSIDDYTNEWKKFNGVIAYKPDPKNPQAVPQQISANSTNIGVFELLNLQLNLMQQISGVSSAIQGQEAKSGVAASLFAQQAQNSATNLMPLFKTFMYYKSVRDFKLLKTLAQFYDKPRYISVSGSIDDDQSWYEPEKAKNLEFDITVTEGTSTPVYRQMQEEYLWKMFEVQAINVEQFLSNSSLPFSDKLLDQISKSRESQDPSALTGNAEMGQALKASEQGADPKALNLINQMMTPAA